MDDIQPSIAIVGAGPIGIEAALYARFLGFPVTVFERGQVCQHIRRWGHVQLFSPFAMNSSSLGISAIQAQTPDHSFPDPDSLHTGQQWVDDYLGPLSQTDLVRPSLQTQCTVTSIARDTTRQNDETGRSETPFRIMFTSESGQQQIEYADIVLDTTGTWGNARPFGRGGAAAMGESQLDDCQLAPGQIFSRVIPDLSEIDLSVGTRFIVVGRGYSAATNIMQIARLQESNTDITCTWITRGPSDPSGPMNVIPADSLKYRSELSRSANEVATGSDWMTWIAGPEIDRVQLVDQQFQLTLSNNETVVGDHLLANTGYRGDESFTQALHIHRCYVSGGPMAWAASIMGGSDDCLQQVSAGPDALKTTEPNFYILGSKAYGTDPKFLFATGLQQIRDAFKIIAQRDTLDLYTTMNSNAASG